MNLESLHIPLKTVVVIVLWAASIVGVYYTIKFKVDEALQKAEKLEQRMDKFNPEVMDYKITEIQNNIKNINETTNRITILLSQ